MPSPALQRLQRYGIPIGALLLIAFFVLLGFPWDRVRDLVASRAGSALGARVSLGGLGPGLSLRGPVLRADAVQVAWPDGDRLVLDRVAVRPALSLAWLKLDPALFVDAESDRGRAVGTLVLGEEPGFDGTLERVDLARLPLEAQLGGAALEGMAEVELDVWRSPRGPRGELQFEATAGSLALPGVPLALPYESLTGEARLTEEKLVDDLELDLRGPMLTALVTGDVGASPVMASAPLDLELRVQVVDPQIQPMLSGTGIRFGQDGSAEMRLLGTAGRPVLR